MAKITKKSTWMRHFVISPKYTDIELIEMERRSRVAAGRHYKKGLNQRFVNEL